MDRLEVENQRAAIFDGLKPGMTIREAGSGNPRGRLAHVMCVDLGFGIGAARTWRTRTQSWWVFGFSRESFMVGLHWLDGAKIERGDP